jgi:hypothetical protein
VMEIRMFCARPVRNHPARDYPDGEVRRDMATNDCGIRHLSSILSASAVSQDVVIPEGRSDVLTAG